jgi:DNA invertase Pin-like site-specific DNA recombinase
MEQIIKYRRVSTDEQANTGQSLTTQSEALDRYIHSAGANVAIDILDDYSGKSFERPGFQKILSFVNAAKGQKYTLIFTRWDRFSRADIDITYGMIKTLLAKGCKIHCIEQPVDVSVAENLFILAVYLTQPKVEWLNIQSRVTKGMLTARKKGEWCGPPPLGYKWQYAPEKKKNVIVPNPDKVELIEAAFQTILNGGTVPDVITLFNKNKTFRARSVIYNLLHNPVYCGKIFIKEDGEAVQGNHDPIISESTFNRVQDILSGKSRSQTKRNEFPLKGRILCPDCGKMYTASISSGRTAKYAYYHCQQRSHTRVQSNEVHSALIQLLDELQPSKGVTDVYKHILTEVYAKATAKNKELVQTSKGNITKLHEKLSRLDDLVMDGSLAPDDYARLKNKLNEQLAGTITHKAELQVGEETFKKHVQVGVLFVSRLGELYQKATDLDRARLVGSIFPENLTFENGSFRTTRINAVLSLFATPNKGLSKLKIGPPIGKSDFVAVGSPYATTFELFNKDLMLIYNLRDLVAA